MILRAEMPGEAAAIGALITAAFATAAHADGTEAAIMGRLRDSGDLLLSRVAEDAGGLRGHIAASPVTIGGVAGWACIAPVSVAPAAQRQGVGTALMRAALAELQAQGVGGVMILGDPGYYGRFGFVADPRRHVPDVPGEFLLSQSFGTAPEGVVSFHPAFGPA